MRTSLSVFAPLAAVALLAGSSELTLASGPADPQAQGLVILVYHQLRSSGSEPVDSLTAISTERFEHQMRFLRDEGYRTLTMDEVMRFLEGERFPEKSVAIQFDDGWKSDVQAAAILARYGHRASFWIIPGTGIGWPHLDWAEVEAIAANPHFEFFSHTMTHPWKPNDTMLDWLAGHTPGKNRETATWEIGESRRLLEEKLGRPVRYLAWPSGHYNDTLVDVATRAGYRGLLTIDEGVNRPGGDPYRIHRTMVHGGCDDDTFKRLLTDGRHHSCD